MKIGIFGGTFDPIHLGHIQLADSAVKEKCLDELYFMPNFISPFKLGQHHSAAEDRIEMIKRILKYNDAFRISTYETDKREVSYTYNTLEAMHNKLSESELYFVLGFDSVLELDTWFRGENLLKRFPIVTGVRPGTSDIESLHKIEEYRLLYSSDITVLHSDYVNVSSTEIRERAAEGKSLEGMVSPEVEEYINEKNLYKD